ncbi:hypothetical protein GCM10007881_01380 [Mesorhizobium huakuii]|uniref:Uncharacterized protein n=1 Tax=Mesorhizobium huakuii TaxID=28104 RepID=A0ABZ0VKH5_9HYPH|nr:hypothetical protein [Mesorhizobium huakuii]WQB97377.1 hypothetical protein U0R22_001501 [Mesorhizobium huakuii]GLQ76623.1 hypothetical protein GCM10007881_01380 [Mesorhizobium huakuii]
MEKRLEVPEIIQAQLAITETEQTPRANVIVNGQWSLGMENTNSAKRYTDILYVLGVALIEIRASASLEEAQIVADIFHNVPAKISASEEPEAIETELLSKAKRHGREQAIKQLLKHAKQAKIK